MLAPGGHTSGPPDPSSPITRVPRCPGNLDLHSLQEPLLAGARTQKASPHHWASGTWGLGGLGAKLRRCTLARILA